MLKSDAQQDPVSSNNIDSINEDVVSEIERELIVTPYDVVSLVFLLYDVPDLALQKLIVYQRLSKDVMATNLNLLQDWARSAKTKENWKHEFIEALLICQLYGIVKKLGFNIPNLKRHYQPDNIHITMYINPMKKALYKICENINSDNLVRLKRTLVSMNVSVESCGTEFESCELVFLKLMSEKFITVNKFDYNKISMKCGYNIDKLIMIIEKFPGLDTIVSEVKALQSKITEPESDVTKDVNTSLNKNDISKVEEQPIKANDFMDVYEMFDDLTIDDSHLKADTVKDNHYSIKNKNKVGVCLIINQEEFYLSEKSIKDSSLKKVLDKRNGSSADKIALQKTMSLYNFEVITGDNLSHEEMISFIKNIINNKVHKTDSVFMLCIMSHGVVGHVFAADCVKVKVDNIKNLLDSDEASKLRGIPKVMIIQACQIEEEQECRLVADSPNTKYYLRKSDFLVYWATTPEYAAYRDEKDGSIFIQFLCRAIKKYAKREHLYDIFTKVNNAVTYITNKKKLSQVPIFDSTLRKKVYIHIPE